MIVATGIDIIEIERMKRVLERHSAHFLDHVFTACEQAQAPQNPVATPTFYAGRWAAKEAVAKALGTGIGRQCGWTDIVTSRTEQGAPCVRLEGRAARTAEKKDIDRIHISISHEKQFACAQAIAENTKK
ncbi:MAG: holo-ACP synthase [Lentisphaeria bacterium]|nr:holo-ACP synthase [Lentisphaeria bacterium]